MSDSSSTPMASMFEASRRSIEQGQRLFDQSLDVQAAMLEAAGSGMRATKSAQRQGVSMGRSATHAYLDALESTMPEQADAFEGMRDAVDESFDAYEDAHEDTWRVVERSYDDGMDAYDDLTAAQREWIGETVSTMLGANAFAGSGSGSGN